MTPDGGASADPPAPARRRPRWLRPLGAVIALVAVALLVRALAGQWSTVGPALRDVQPLPLALALLASAGAMIGLALLWWRCLHEFGSPIAPGDAVAWYFGGELGKYLPGGVWQVVGRGELARRGGAVSRGDAYGTTLVSYGTMCVGAAVVCGALAPFLAADDRGLGWGWVMLALVPLGLLSLHPAVLGRVLRLAARASGGRVALDAPSWRRMLVLVAWSIPTWVLVGVSAVLVAAALGFDSSPARVAFASIAAWILGFLLVPVPAGAGVRELLFVGISGVAAGPAAAVAALSRVLFIVVDGVGGVLGLGRSRRGAAATNTVNQHNGGHEAH